MDDCIFCRIVDKKIPAELMHEEDDLLVFPDIKPKAPVHLLIIPKKHIASLNEIEGEKELMGKLMLTAKKMAKKAGVAKSGYRLVVNCGKDSGQEVNHLHIHLLGGKNLKF